MKRMLALPIPPLVAGVSWTGRSLLNYVVREIDPDGKGLLLELHEQLGPDRFRRLFEDKAVELNARFDARGHEGTVESTSVEIGNGES